MRVRAASVRILVGFLWCRFLEKGSEGRADGPTAQRLLHAEVVHHALLHFLFGGGEKKAAKDSQLQKQDPILKKRTGTVPRHGSQHDLLSWHKKRMEGPSKQWRMYTSGAATPVLRQQLRSVDPIKSFVYRKCRSWLPLSGYAWWLAPKEGRLMKKTTVFKMSGRRIVCSFFRRAVQNWCASYAPKVWN